MIEKYFDFESCWDDISKEDLEDYDPLLESITMESAQDFLLKPTMPMDLEQCEIDGDYVAFRFSEVWESANESSCDESFCTITVVLDTISEHIIYVGYEQG